LPEAQSKQVAALTALYFPAPQMTQSASASWFVAIVAASGRYVPAGQATHVLEAIPEVNFPASQITQSENESWLVANVAAS
jgi:hypothetical protein